MKRIISIILVLTFTLALFTTTVFADSRKGKGSTAPGMAKKELKLPKGISKKVFDDIDDMHWAKQAIELMKSKGLIRGYSERIFAPDNAVTKLETIVMALRIMGWEEETKYIKELPKKYKAKKIDDWGKGYVTVAYEKGILDDVDMLNFNPNEPAKRYEVAKYVIKALGYEEEAQDYMDEDLPFIDAELVPQGAVGYVYLVNDMGLMKGDHRQAFNPMGTLTRAEMAVLFRRLDEKVDSDVDNGEYEGTINRIDDEKITLNIDGKSKSFEVSDDVVVYKDNRRIDYSDLEVGLKVIITIDDDDEVVSIEVIDKESDREKIITKFKGKVIGIVTRGSKEISVKVDTMKVTFEIVDHVKVYFDDELGKFDEIEIGDEVSVIVDSRNRARVIYVNREKIMEVIETVKGYITDIDLKGSYNLEIDNLRYSLSDDAEVEIDGRTNKDLDDLRIGYYVKCKLVDDVITEIDAENRFKEINGIIEDVDKDTIEVLIGSRLKKFKFADSVEIYIDGDESVYDNLEEGMKVELKVINDVVYEIYAEED